MHAKEPSPRAEYLAVNHDQLVGLIDLSGELLLRHEPVVSMMAEAAAQPSISIWGQELESYDPNTATGDGAIMRAQAARRRLSDFMSQAALHMLSSDAAATGAETASSAPTFTSAQVRRTLAVVNASARTFASLEFAQAETGRQVTLEAMTMHGEAAPLARGLVLHIDDELLTRNLVVGHLEGAPASRESALWVAQSVGPVQDGEIRHMLEFFLADHDDADGYAVLLKVFQQELRQRPIEALVTQLHERYTDELERAQVSQFVALMRQRAEAIREQLGLIVQNPELSQPSVQDLNEYTQLLRSLLG